MATEPRNSKTRISAQKRQKPSDAGERYEDTMKSAVLTAIVALAIVFAPSALAAGNGPTKSVYDHKGNQVQNVAAALRNRDLTPAA